MLTTTAFSLRLSLFLGLRSVPSVDDGKDLNDLLEALRLFMPDSKLRLVMRLLTAILHIGTLSIIGE